MEASTKGATTPAAMFGAMETSPAVPQLSDALDKPIAHAFPLRHAAELFSLMVLDLIGLAFSFFLALLLRVHILPALSSIFPRGISLRLMATLWWLPITFVLFFAYEGLYSRRQPFWREFYSLVKAVTLAFVVALAVVSLGKLQEQVSRTVILLTWINSLVTLPIARYTGKNWLARIGVWQRPVIVLGAGKTGELVARALTREPYLGYYIYGFLDDDPAKRARGIQVNGIRYPVLGGFRDSDAVMEATGVRHLIVAAPGMPSRALVGLVNRLQRRADTVLVVPDLFGLPVAGVEADYFFDEQALAFKVRNNLANPLNAFLKRVFDLAAGIIVLILALPIMALIALAIVLDSPGPVIFAHRRIGRTGKEFKCYKFRTMVINAQEVLKDILSRDPRLREEWERDFKLKNDPRVTRVGRILRRTSLDELPQIFNVLRGEMSLVGPRPRPLYERERKDKTGLFEIGLGTKPGMTGLWQVSGRSELDFMHRLMLDAWYARNWSLWIDITLILRTIPVLLRRCGAY